MFTRSRGLALVTLVTLVTVGLVLTAGSAAAQTAEEFNETFGGAVADSAWSVTQTSDGGFALGARTLSFGTQTDAWLIKTDRNGNVEINETFGGGSFDQARSVAQTSDDGFALAGQTGSFGPGSEDPFNPASNAWLIRTDANGNEEFNETFGGADTEFFSEVEQTSDDGFALAGWTTGSFGPGSSAAWLIKTDEDGNEEINETFGGSEGDSANSVVQTSDGGFALAGETVSFGSGSGDAWLIKTDGDGNVEFTKTFGGSSADEAFSVVQTSDGGFALAGRTGSFGSGGFDAWLIKTDENGNEKFNETFGGPVDDEVFSVVQTFGGGFALGGETRSFSSAFGGEDGWLIKTDENGNEEFNGTFGGLGGDFGRSVAQTRNGSFVLAGRTESFSPGQDAWLVKTTRRFECIDTTGDGDSDSDGDGLCDNWETGPMEIDGEQTDLNLSAMGADPERKDLFLEIDYMRADTDELLIGHLPQEDALQNVTDAFDDAPVPNPDGSQGINLHLRVDGSPTTPQINLSESQALAHRNVLNYTGNGPAADFDNVKDRHFGAPGDSDEKRLARRLTHRYAIFAHRIAPGDKTSGRAEGIPGNDFIVTLGRGENVGNRVGQESTLMHEFGHTLGLRHGGGDNVNCKPNYLSVMSYSFQFPDNIRRPLDYSRQQLPTLNENNLNEPVGVQGPAGRQTLYDAGSPKPPNFDTRTGPANGPIDWNNDTDMADNAVARDINWLNSSVQGGCDTPRERGMDELEGHNDWANIEYNFRNVPAFADGVHPIPPGTQEQPAPPMAIGSTSSALAVETNVSSVEVDETTGVAVNVTSAGIPVNNATVNVTGVGVDVPNATTDADGTATFSLTPDETGDITVRVNKSGFLPNQTTVSASPGTNNPFFDASGNPRPRQEVIDRVVRWNLDGEIDGTPFTRQEIIGFVVDWNLAS